MSGDEDKGCDRVVKKPRREAGLQPTSPTANMRATLHRPHPQAQRFAHPPPFFSKTDVIQIFMALRGDFDLKVYIHKVNIRR